VQKFGFSVDDCTIIDGLLGHVYACVMVKQSVELKLVEAMAPMFRTGLIL
jgi:hypothetical protein